MPNLAGLLSVSPQENHLAEYLFRYRRYNSNKSNPWNQLAAIFPE